MVSNSRTKNKNFSTKNNFNVNVVDDLGEIPGLMKDAQATEKEKEKGAQVTEKEKEKATGATAKGMYVYYTDCPTVLISSPLHILKTSMPFFWFLSGGSHVHSLTTFVNGINYAWAIFDIIGVKGHMHNIWRLVPVCRLDSLIIEEL